MANIFKEAKKIQRVHKSWSWQKCIQEASKRHKPKKVGAAKKTKRASSRQTGTSNKVYDEMRHAQTPGARIPAGGTKVTYYERRKNRSDAPGKLTGVTLAQLKNAAKEKLKLSLGKQLVQKELAKTKRAKHKIQKVIVATRSQLKKFM